MPCLINQFTIATSSRVHGDVCVTEEDRIDINLVSSIHIGNKSTETIMYMLCVTCSHGIMEIDHSLSPTGYFKHGIAIN